MALYDHRKLVLDLAILAAMATILAVALMLTIRCGSGDDFLRKPVAIAAALADISLAMTGFKRSG